MPVGDGEWRISQNVGDLNSSGIAITTAYENRYGTKTAVRKRSSRFFRRNKEVRSELASEHEVTGTRKIALVETSAFDPFLPFSVLS
jgi:hypothetical protein